MDLTWYKYVQAIYPCPLPYKLGPYINDKQLYRQQQIQPTPTVKLSKKQKHEKQETSDVFDWPEENQSLGIQRKVQIESQNDYQELLGNLQITSQQRKNYGSQKLKNLSNLFYSQRKTETLQGSCEKNAYKNYQVKFQSSKRNIIFQEKYAWNSPSQSALKKKHCLSRVIRCLYKLTCVKDSFQDIKAKSLLQLLESQKRLSIEIVNSQKIKTKSKKGFINRKIRQNN